VTVGAKDFIQCILNQGVVFYCPFYHTFEFHIEFSWAPNQIIDKPRLMPGTSMNKEKQIILIMRKKGINKVVATSKVPQATLISFNCIGNVISTNQSQ
jgi:hypothetical protein